MKDAVKDASTVSKTQQDELVEKLSAEVRALTERAKNAEASNGRLARLNERHVARITELELELDEAIERVPAPEHVQRTLEQFQRRESDLVAEKEAIEREMADLRLEFSACLETAKELKEAHRAETDGKAGHHISFQAPVGLSFTWKLDERSRKAVQDFERSVVERALRSGVTVDDLARVVAEYPQEMAGWPEKIAVKDLVRYRKLARTVARVLGVTIQDPPDIRTVRTTTGEPVQIVVGAGGAEAAEKITREADPWGLAPAPAPRITYSEQGGLVFSWDLDRESREAVQAFEAHLSKRSQEELAAAVRDETVRLREQFATAGTIRAPEPFKATFKDSLARVHVQSIATILLRAGLSGTQSLAGEVVPWSVQLIQYEDRKVLESIAGKEVSGG